MCLYLFDPPHLCASFVPKAALALCFKLDLVTQCSETNPGVVLCQQLKEDIRAISKNEASLAEWKQALLTDLSRVAGDDDSRCMSDFALRYIFCLMWKTFP